MNVLLMLLVLPVLRAVSGFLTAFFAGAGTSLRSKKSRSDVGLGAAGSPGRGRFLKVLAMRSERISG